MIDSAPGKKSDETPQNWTQTLETSHTERPLPSVLSPLTRPHPPCSLSSPQPPVSGRAPLPVADLHRDRQLGRHDLGPEHRRLQLVVGGGEELGRRGRRRLGLRTSGDAEGGPQREIRPTGGGGPMRDRHVRHRRQGDTEEPPGRGFRVDRRTELKRSLHISVSLSAGFSGIPWLPWFPNTFHRKVG